MKNKGQGYYWFEDGVVVWYYALSSSEKKKAIAEHGAIKKYVPTYQK